jgi:hypothetical protein
VYGPYATATGANFASVLGTLSAGTHTYSITATDKLGNTTSTAYSGTFTVAAPPQATISGVMVVEATGERDGTLTTSESILMTWSAVDPDGVARATLQIDGRNIASVWGPYATATGADFAATPGTLAAGTHTYSIVATDKLGNSTVTAYTGSFNVVAALPVDATTAPQGLQASLTDQQLSPMIVEAERRLATIYGSQVLATMAGVNVQVADLPSGMLGEEIGKTIRIDRDAAGYGWFIDPTPTDDLEFAEVLSPTSLAARNDSPAANRVDLLTTVMHEMGHVLGYNHTADGLMSATLPLGVRRIAAVDQVFATSPVV